MEVLQEIFKWSEGLPQWQSDAVARLLAQETLTADDLDDLFALLKTAHGIPDPDGRIPKPLTADQIPVPSQASKNVALLAVKNMLNVNALAKHTLLPFGSNGLTVIYGDNGSGKSGYSRVLKRACRARDKIEQIYPNANLPAAEVGIAEADFEISVNGSVQNLHWTDGKTAPPELSSLSIFDTRCARAYVDNEDDFSYIPYGLDVFERLARVCGQLKVKIETEHAQHAVDLTAFAHLHGDTAVGKLITALSAKTPLETIEKLANLTLEELTYHAELDRSLKESNPKEKSNQLRLQSRRIAIIAANAINKCALVDKPAVTKLKNLVDSFLKAQAAAMLAAQKFNEGENLLPGTGGAAWKALFEAARKFALESYAEKIFPNLSMDDPCPLCQQPLAEGAARLLRFEAFIQQDTEKTVQACRKALDEEYKSFSDHVLTLTLDDVTYSEIEAIDSQLAIDTRAFEKTLVTLHNDIKEAIKTNKWNGIDSELSSPAIRLQDVANRLNAEAETLEKASDEKARATLQKQFAEIDARIRLNQIKDAVIKAVTRLDHQTKLAHCLSAVKTNAISLKSSELTEQVVSRQLAEALNREFKALGVNQLHVSLQSRSDRGKALHKLRLEIPQSRNPGDILSEGEQRAVAIAAFLAEVDLSGGTGGIVFDDPVSSFDHLKRELIAKRLVAEGTHRQVIIFTHDIYFLCILVEEANAVGVPIIPQSLTQRAEGFGVPDPELPFEGNNTARRIGDLKARHQIISKLHRNGDVKEYRRHTVDAYYHLRMAWERAIEEVLFRKVILRFRKSVETNRLKGVSVDDTDYRQVDAGMSKCSNYAHDKALIGGIAVPEPDELLNDIMTLENWRKQLETRNTETEKRRK